MSQRFLSRGSASNRAKLVLMAVLAASALALNSFAVDITASDWCDARICQAWVARYSGSGPIASYEAAQGLAVDRSGNVYVTGSSYTTDFAYYDYATVKYLPDGSQAWVARYGSSSSGYDQNYAAALALDAVGNTYVAGGSTGYGLHSVYATVKYLPDGSQAWAAQYHGPGTDYHPDSAIAVAVDLSGNVYVTGSSWGVSTYYDCATIKYLPDGTEAWAARYDSPVGGNEEAVALAVDASGDVYVAARVANWSSSSASYDYAIIKYLPDGTQAWVSRYDGPASREDIPMALAVDWSGSVYVTGRSEDSGGGYDYATVKYLPDGSQAWVARHNGSGVEGDASGARDLALDWGGNVYVTGSWGNPEDYLTVKYLPDGSQAWEARYDGPAGDYDAANSIAVDDSGNVYVTGASTQLTNTPGPHAYDYVTIKYLRDGRQDWLTRYNGPDDGGDYASHLSLDPFGNLYVTGNSEGTGTYSDYATVKYVSNPMGGVAEYSPPEQEASRGGPSSTPNRFTLAGLATGAILLLTAGGWYARRRSLH
jgi:hypothetical protein